MILNPQAQLFGCPTVAMNLETLKAKQLWRKRHKVSSFKEKKEDFKGYIVNVSGKSRNKFLFDELEAQIDFAKRKCIKAVIEKNIEIAKKNLLVAEAKMLKGVNQMQGLDFPRWYQELSYDQLNHVMALEDAILKDQMENVTSLTHKCLRKIGIVSPLVHIPAKIIFNLQRKAQFNAVNFLREIYRVIVGNYFEDEEYKNYYSCNERLILSSIAALTFPELVNELHKKLPLKYPQFPPNPNKSKPKKSLPTSNPYEKDIPTPMNWRSRKQDLLKRQKTIRTTPKPKLISFHVPITKNLSEYCLGNWDSFKSKSADEIQYSSQSEEVDENCQEERPSLKDKDISVQTEFADRNCTQIENCGENLTEDILSYKIREPSQNQDFPKKNFSKRRQRLSLKMHDWLNHLDCDVSNFKKLAEDLIKKMNKIVNSVRLVPNCDGCCACRQIAKKDFGTTETPNATNLIDTMVIDSDDNTIRRKLIESTTIISPFASIVLDEFPKIYEEHMSVRTPVIQGVMENEEETVNLVSGVTIYEDTVVYSGRGASERKILNVPSCDCMVSRGLAEKAHGPKCEQSCCVGRKYRPSDETSCNVKNNFGCWNDCDFDSAEMMQYLNYDYDKDSDIFDEKFDEEYFTSEKLDKQVKRLHGGSDNFSYHMKQTDSSAFNFDQYKESLLNKTMVHLVDPVEPIKSIPVRAGEEACRCRETRDAVTKVLHGIGGSTIVKDKISKTEKVVPVLTGAVVYVTEPKPYISEDYIPEYELKEPIGHLTCGGNDGAERMTDRELMEYFLNPKNNLRCWKHSPKSIIERTIEVRKPVCECMYDRKTVREREEKERRQAREKKMRTYKKRPILGVAGSYKPINVESKLVVTGAKKCPTPRGKMDLKLCVSGISVVTTEEPLVRVISGVKLHTPFVTPSSSVTSLCPCLNKKKCDRVYRDSTCEVKSFSMPSKIFKDNNNKNGLSAEMIKQTDDKDSGKKKTFKKSKGKENESPTDKQSRKTFSGGQIMRSKEEKHSSVVKESDDAGIKEGGVKTNKQLLKEELETLKEKGYVFAMLPECEKVPQLKIWIMHRKGIFLTKKQREKISELTRKKLNNIDERNIKRAEPPSFEMSSKQLRSLTYDRANEMKNKIKAAKNLFYSEVRQERVDRSRLYWNTYDPIRFPIKRFKQIYFAYMPGPETDGFFFKP